MKSNILSILAIVLFAFTSCMEDGAMNDMEKYKTIVYFPNSGLTKVTLYKTGENTTYDLNVYKAGYDTKAQPKVSVKLLSQSEVDNYNTLNKTSYSLLPSYSYTIKSDSTLKFSSNDLVKALKIEFDTDTINALGANVLVNSVLAFELSSSTDSINSSKKIVFINLEVVTPVISFQTPGDLVYNPTPNQEDPVNFGSFLRLPIKSVWNFTTNIQVDATLIAKYNTDNNTQYILLPDSAYTLPKGIQFTKGDMVKNIGLNVDLSKLKLGYYILPIKIASTDMSGLQVDTKFQYIILNYQPRKSTLTPIALAESMIVKHPFVTTWGNGLPGLFADGDTKTYAHSSASLKPDALYGLSFDVQLPNQVNSAYLSYSTRDWAGNAPKRIAVFTSNNGTSWVKALSISSGLPSASAHSTVYESLVFSSEKSFNYIRFSVLESHNGIMDDVSKSTAGAFVVTEFRLWAK